MGTVSLILTILGVVEPILAGAGAIPPNYQGLATGVLNAINAVKTDLTGANGQLTINAVALTQAIASGVQALEVSGAIPGGPNASLALALSTAAAEGAAAFAKAGAGVDTTQLQPIAPVA